MRKTILFLLVSISLLFVKETVYSVMLDSAETIVLKLPKDYSSWREISRIVDEKKCIVERIPLDQTNSNWSELIAIQYADKENLIMKGCIFIEDCIDLIREQTINSHPGKKVTWRIIDKCKTNIIYEWILHEQYKDIPPQHEIARAFLTEKGFHRIGFTRKNNEMNLDEREKWIELLRESVSVVSMEEARNIPHGLSMVDKLKDSLDLGATFRDWKVINTYNFEMGYTMVISIPPSQKENEYIIECLEMTTTPNFNSVSIDKFFETEKMILHSRSEKVNFTILKKTPNEIIYSFVHPKDHLLLTGVVRSFISNHGYYSICYKYGLPNELSKEKVLQWKECLEAIKILDF